MDNIVLIGMPGAGKSTVGVLLAKTLGYMFLDTDLVLQQREGTLLQELLDTRGQAAFLEAEADAICAVDCAHTVIAPGGSAVCLPRGARHLSTLGAVVYLRIPLEEVTARLGNIRSRGIAMAPGQGLAELYALRAPLYETCADLTVDTAGQTLEETVSAVLRALAGTHNPPLTAQWAEAISE